MSKNHRNENDIEDSALRQLSERMTCHGLQDLYNAKSKVAFVFWASVLAICTVTLCFSIYKCCIHFYEEPILTTMEVQPAEILQFPDITVCPTDFLNYTKFQKTSQDRQDHIMLFKNSIVDNKDQELVNGTFRRISILFSAKGIGFRFSSLAEQQKEILNYSLDPHKFIHKSDFGNIKRKLDLVNGVCYVLNATGLNQTYAGAGKKVIVDLNSYDEEVNDPYLLSLTDGITVRTGRPAYDPMMRGGILIPPGSYARLLLSVRKEHFITVTQFTKRPSHCINAGDFDFSMFNVQYSSAACELDCFAKYHFEKDSCSLAIDVEYLKQQNNTIYERYCSSIADFEYYRNQNQSCNKKCYPECDLTTYDITMTIHKFPSNKLINLLSHNTDIVIDDSLCERDWKTCKNEPDSGIIASCITTTCVSAIQRARHWKENIIIMEIVFDEMKIKSISETQSMTFFTLLSDLGGTLGLWLGASFFYNLANKCSATRGMR